MKKLVLHIYTLNTDFVLEVENDSQVAFDNYIEFLSIFLKKLDDKFIVGTPIQMSREIRKKYQNYVEKYKRQSPILNKFQKSLDLIADNEFFWIDFNYNHTNEKILFIENLIRVYNKSNNDQERAKIFEERYKSEKELFGNLLDNYDISVFDTSIKKNIGESDRKKRVCRFCGKNTKDGATFRLKAHAISEALGNKLLVLNEECDDCNAMFGSKIETDFIQYLDIYRVFFKVKGKKGIPTIKYKEGGLVKSISKEDIPKNILIDKDDLTVVISKNIEFNEETGSLNVLLESQQKLKEVNIYKTLCKYVLSTIEKEELPFLKKTIDWVNDDNVEKPLPNVAMTIINELFVENPILIIYINKNKTNLPHVVAEFRFKSLIFVFILPFSCKDKIDYRDKEVFDVLWKVFKHYDHIKTWKFYDYSSIEEKKYPNVIRNKME